MRERGKKQRCGEREMGKNEREMSKPIKTERKEWKENKLGI